LFIIRKFDIAGPGHKPQIPHPRPKSAAFPIVLKFKGGAILLKNLELSAG